MRPITNSGPGSSSGIVDATTLNSVHVTILPAGSPPPAEAGNTFILEPVIAVSVKWPSGRELLISHERRGRVLKQEQQVADVSALIDLNS